jgi:RNA ligase partner protein
MLRKFITRKRTLIIDTSLFVNPDAFCFWGSDSKTALVAFISAAKKKHIGLICPPSVWDEIAYFIELDKLDPTLTGYIKKQYPRRYEIPVPGLFLYELVEETRNRVNKGLRIAEKYMQKADIKEKPAGELKKSLRNEYREALREGILDSCADVDMLLLAREHRLPLATADNGLKDWSKRLGIEYLDLKELKAELFG